MVDTLSTPDRLVDECQGLVRHLVQQVRGRMPKWVETDDLIGYGQVGLVQAARDFDATRGTKFSTFAFYRIRGAIFDGVNKLMWFRSSRHPEARYGPMADDLLKNACGESTSSQGSPPDLEQEATWVSRVANSLAVVYLAASDDGGRPTEIVDEAAPAPWEGIVEQETSRKLRQAMEAIPQDAAALIRAVYYEDRTLQEAADRLGISKSWASRLHARALEQLASNLKQLDP
jgi:RNA polymerase sigma factor FliA